MSAEIIKTLRWVERYLHQEGYDAYLDVGRAADMLEHDLIEARRDAERYRRVRENPAMLLHLKNSEFDAAIDAMEEKNG